MSRTDRPFVLLVLTFLVAAFSFAFSAPPPAGTAPTSVPAQSVVTLAG
jgi:hypothetical protein